MRFAMPRHDSEGRERDSDPLRGIVRAVGQRKIDSPDAIGAEIGFERDGMLFLAVLIEIGLAAEHADFLGAGPQQADRAAGLARRPYLLFRRGCDASRKRSR